MPELSRRFTVYAVARRGRGATNATQGHSLADEIDDAAAVVSSLETPVFLLGHSYGAHVALGTAAQMPDRVRKLVLYEAPWPNLLDEAALARLLPCAEAGDWDSFCFRFFHERLRVPADELNALRGTPLWAPILADAPASFGDLLALSRYRFQPESFAHLRMPVSLQTGSASPRDLYVTDALLQVLPNASLTVFDGQAHEGMTTAPEQYVNAVLRFLEPAAVPARA
jgi:pimeloyl-ACP methyl ester carboxylesterase